MPAPNCTGWARNRWRLAHLFRFATTVLVFIAALSSVALAQPAVTVRPTSGPPTERAVVSGTGFGANEAVDIYFDTADMALAATGPSGSFTGVGLTIPASAAPGTHWITGVGRHSGLAAQTTFILQTDWPQFRRGPEHQGYNATENVLDVASVKRLRLLWSATLGAGINNSSPVVANGVVYVGALDGSVYAFKAVTGQLLWSQGIGEPIQDSPAVAKGVSYATSYGELYALDAATGHVNWYTASDGFGESSSAVANGVVYVASEFDNDLYAFDATTGQQVWKAASAASISSSPAVANGVVYVGSSDKKLNAFNAATGRPLWSAATSAAISSSSPAVANGVVYVGSDDKKLYAFNAATGQLLWSAATAASISSSPAVANGLVYVGSLDHNLYAFNAVTGQPAWSAATGNQIWSSPAVANGVVYVGSNDFKLYAFNAATGQPVWSAATGGQINSSPAVANGIVYIGSDKLYAFGLRPADASARPNPATLQPDLTLLPSQ